MMLSFIRKRLPSKDRNNEHLQNVKSNRIQHEHQDDQMKRTQSANELDLNDNQKKIKKKNKNKQRSSATLEQIVIPLNTSTINKSYSDVDYFPLMPGALSQSNNYDKTLQNDDLSSDCYLNPLEAIQTTNPINYVQTTVTKPRVFQIPVIDCRKEQQLPNYKDVDHQRTNALRQVTEHRMQQRSMK